MLPTIDYHGTLGFPVAPEELWTAVEEIDRVEEWCSWLSDVTFEGEGLESGSILQGVVTPPVPYRMRVRVEITQSVRPSSVDLSVHGDIDGRAEFVLRPCAGGTDVEASWSITPMQRPMRVAVRLARPLIRWGHDRLVEATANSFRRMLAARQQSPEGRTGSP